MTDPETENENWPPEDIDLNDPRWLSVTEAAYLSRADERTVRRWARERRIAVWLPSGKCWIDRRRLFSAEPPETPDLPGNVKSSAPTLPGIFSGE